MTIQEKIQSDLKEAIIKNNKTIRDSLKIIVSEFQRQKNKKLSDEESVEILRKLKGWAEEDLEYTAGVTESVYLNTIKKYIPEQLADESIKEWIKENIDLSQFKNKLAATKMVLKHFGAATSGAQVSNVLRKI